MAVDLIIVYIVHTLVFQEGRIGQSNEKLSHGYVLWYDDVCKWTVFFLVVEIL